jgi:hypothetical protein
MTHKNIGWHTRSWQNGTKIEGGSFGGDFSLETANRLVKSHFGVRILPTGTPVFTDRSGREVWLYMSVDAASTDIGRAALDVWRKKEAAAEAANAALTLQQDAEIESLVAGLSRTEIIHRLRRTP